MFQSLNFRINGGNKLLSTKILGAPSRNRLVTKITLRDSYHFREFRLISRRAALLFHSFLVILLPSRFFKSIF